MSLNANGSTNLKLASAGQIGRGGATYGTAGQVITSGGIIGTIERVMDNDRAEVAIGENTKVEIVRSTGVQGLLKTQEQKK